MRRAPTVAVPQTPPPRPMCSRHPTTPLMPSRARRGALAGCWRCAHASPGYAAARRRYRALPRVRAARQSRRRAHTQAVHAALLQEYPDHVKREGVSSPSLTRFLAKAERQRRATNAARQRRYYARHREACMARGRAWRETVPGQLAAHDYNSARRRARELAWLDSDLTARVPQFTHLG